jgi:hypothetical protein
MTLWTALAAIAALLVAFAAGVVVGVTVDDDDSGDRDAVRLTLEDGALSVEGLGALDLGSLGALGDLGELLRERFEGLEGELQRRGGAVLGVTVEEGDGGVAVAHVTPGGPAEDAGVRPGDVIRRVDGRRVETIEALREALSALPADLDAYELELQRGDRTLIVEVERRGFVAVAPDGLLGRLFGDGDGDGDGEARRERERLLEDLRRDAQSRLQPRPGDRFELPSPRELTPQAPGVTPEQLERRLERLRVELGGALRAALAEALEPLRRAEQPQTLAVPAPLESERLLIDSAVFFGRVAQLDGDSIVLTGSLGPVTLAITPETQFPAGRPALGDLVTSIASGRVASVIAVVG